MTEQDMNSVATAVASERKQIQVIALRIGPELFCLDILSVREIVRTGEFSVTRVPNAFPYIDGVVNLRGKIVPVVDLTRRLELESVSSDKGRMVVLEIGDAMVGFLVDSVSEVLVLDADTFEGDETPGEGFGQTATVKGKIMTLIDVGQLLQQDSLSVTGARREG